MTYQKPTFKTKLKFIGIEKLTSFKTVYLPLHPTVGQKSHMMGRLLVIIQEGINLAPTADGKAPKT